MLCIVGYVLVSFIALVLLVRKGADNSLLLSHRATSLDKCGFLFFNMLAAILWPALLAILLLSTVCDALLWLSCEGLDIARAKIENWTRKFRKESDK
mgnify:CR=1 FL=1